MITTTRLHRDQQGPERDGAMSMLLAAGVAATAVLGYGIALGLARATEYAEQVEEDEYCHPADVPAQR